ncbi:27313_t:CDS:2, partial [Gigaspora margarita]
LNISLLIVKLRKMIKIENEKETDNLTITITAYEIHIETDPEAEIIIIEIETIIIEIEAVRKIEITEMTKMTTTLEVVIDLLTLLGDPLIVPPHLTTEMLIILMELLLPLPVPQPEIVPKKP